MTLPSLPHLYGQIVKLDFVTPNLAVGSRHIDSDRCQRNSITHVLSVCLEPDDIEGVVCLHNPMQDEGQDMPEEYWKRTIRIAEQILSVPYNRLYVHCSAGVNRGPANTYAILRGVFRFNREEACDRIVDARPQAGKGHVMFGNDFITIAELNLALGRPENDFNTHFLAYINSVDKCSTL